MKRIIIASAAVALTLLISACNTFQGMGQDIQAAGHALSSSANDTKKDINTGGSN